MLPCMGRWCQRALLPSGSRGHVYELACTLMYPAAGLLGVSRLTMESALYSHGSGNSLVFVLCSVKLLQSSGSDLCLFSHPRSSVSPIRSDICFQLFIPDHSEVEATLRAQWKHHTLPGVLAAAGRR